MLAFSPDTHMVPTSPDVVLESFNIVFSRLQTGQDRSTPVAASHNGRET